jgi:hypothetical protein
MKYPPPPKWRVTPCRLSEAAYSKYLKLLSIAGGHFVHPQNEHVAQFSVPTLHEKYILPSQKEEGNKIIIDLNTIDCRLGKLEDNNKKLCKQILGRSTKDIQNYESTNYSYVFIAL